MSGKHVQCFIKYPVRIVHKGALPNAADQKQLSGKKNCEYEDGEKPFFFFACRSHEPEKDAAEGGDEKHSGSDHRNLLCPGKQGIEKTGSVSFGEGEACDICSCCSENQEKQLCRKPR